MIKKLPKLLKTSRLVIDNDDGKIIVYMNTDDKMKKELPFQLIDPVSWGYIYEKYVGQYFESIGYNVNYWGLEKGFNDGGIDIVAEREEEIYYIQCKHLINRTMGKSYIENILYKAGNTISKQNLSKKTTFALVIPSKEGCFSRERVDTSGIQNKYKYTLAEYFLSKNNTQDYTRLEIIEIPMLRR